MKKTAAFLMASFVASADLCHGAEPVMPPPELAKEFAESPYYSSTLCPINDQVWDFHISSIEAKSPNDEEILTCFNATSGPAYGVAVDAHHPRRVLKWSIVTQLRNVSDVNQRLTKVLNLWGTGSGEIPKPYMGDDSSVVYVESLNDFQVLKPEEMMETEHTVFAVEAADHSGYWLSGFSKRNQWPWRADYKVSGDFPFAVILFNNDDFQWGRGLSITSPRVKWLWEGRIRTPAALLTTSNTGQVIMPPLPDKKDRARRSHFSGSYAPSFNDEMLQQRWTEGLVYIDLTAKDLVAAWNQIENPSYAGSPEATALEAELRKKLEPLWLKVIQGLRTPQNLEGSALWTTGKTWERPELRFAWQDLHGRSRDETITLENGRQVNVRFDIYRQLSIDSHLTVTPSQDAMSGPVWEAVRVNVHFVPVLPKSSKNFSPMSLFIDYVNRAPKQAVLSLTPPRTQR